jgi:subtilase family serine protease
VSGNHFLTPADFATIYDINALYSAGADGTGQKIAVVGQSTVSTTDLHNFRSAAGLSASTVTMTLAGGTATKCSGDEGESDLDIEWSGGVAKKAQIIFVFAGLKSGDTCSNRVNSVWDALHYAVTNNVAPFISTSYGFCESPSQGISLSQAQTYQSWAQEALTHGQTIVAASGDAGAADCESASSTSATTGLAVDIPAAIPEVTGAGGNEFSGDTPTCTTSCPPGNNPPYWSAATATTDTVSSALEFIPEVAWNDTTQSLALSPPGGLSASGGGASIYFAKPAWQTATTPADGKRDVPDISISASNFHDPYLVCSEDGDATPCASGFRDSAGGNFFAVGGTSAAAPTFSAILALVNQYIGNTGMAPVNPTLYSLASNPSVFHDVTSGDNKVPCTAPSTNCPSGTMQIGFSAAAGYDEVTGLGSVDAFGLAQALSPFSLSAAPLSPATVAAGTSTTTTITVTPNNGPVGTVSFSCSGLPAGASCSFSPASVPGGSGTTTLTIQTAANTAAGTTSVTVKGSSGTSSGVTSVSLALTATTEKFSLVASPAVATLSVAQGQTTSAVNLSVTSTSSPAFVLTNGSGSTTALPLTYTCSGLPSEATCNFSGGTGSGQTITTSSTAVSFSVITTAPTARLKECLLCSPAAWLIWSGVPVRLPQARPRLCAHFGNDRDA